MTTIAQLVTEYQTVLFAYGPMGVMLAWFMFRAEAVRMDLKDVAHRVDGLTKALLVDMVERESSGDAAKRFAREAIAKIDAREVKDSRKK